MKFRIEIAEDLAEEEIVLRCKELNEDILELQKQLTGLSRASGTLAVSHDDLDYFLKFSEILFLETDGNRVAVHTKKQIFYTKQKLYELEDILPASFTRISKSAILNVREIRSIHKNLAGASEIEFRDTLKKAYVSRNYYKALMDKMTR